MRIAFITNCLEPGKDGVGDYTQLLAQACASQGHPCALVSLSDPYLKHPRQFEIEADEHCLPVLRLPQNIAWDRRITVASDFLNSFQPDWLSLQFVCYGFHPKGIVCGLDEWLYRLVQGRKVHIMFHELWIGEQIGAKLKERIVGKIQRFCVLKLVERLKPQVVHTSNSAYVALLQHCGISVSRLPMFGAIPVNKQNGDGWLFPTLQNLGLKIDPDTRHQFLLLGIFGLLHPVWPAEPLFTYLAQVAAQHDRKIVPISIGRIGSGAKLWERLVDAYSHKFTFVQLGERSPAQISEFFNSIDFGIATSPYSLIGKSATVAAMLEHGLPVIVNRDDIHFKPCLTMQDTEPQLYRMDRYLSKAIGQIHRLPIRSRLYNSAKQLIDDLTAIEFLSIRRFNGRKE